MTLVNVYRFSENYKRGKMISCLKHVFVILILANFLSGCGQDILGTSRKYSQMNPLMGTSAQIDTCLNSPEPSPELLAAYEAVWARLEEIAWRMNIFDERSDVTKINQSAGVAVEIPEDTWDLIKKSIYYSSVTEGAFDITVMPLIKVWKESQSKNVFPSKEDIETVLGIIGSQQIELLPSNQLRLKSPWAKLDLGGIGTGYSLDEAARIFRAHGVLSFFMDIGGDIYAGGLNCDGKPWKVAIRNPFNQKEIMEVVEIVDGAVATSGNYNKYYEIQGERFSHIINPRTGYPQKRVVSATVIAPKAIDTDAYSTALCVLEEERGTALINTLNDNYASLMISRDESQRVKRTQSRMYGKFLAAVSQ
jgi:thiamine biosynthesis lipoprotein